MRTHFLSLPAACAMCFGCQQRQLHRVEATPPEHTEVVAPAPPQNPLDPHWMAKNFGPAEVDPNADPDGDGLSSLQEFQQGTDPNDYYNGILPIITSLVGPEGELGPQDTVQVLITDDQGKPLVNAPITLQAKAGGHQLAATVSGPAMNEITVRTDANGIARGYVRGGTVGPEKTAPNALAPE